MQRVKLAPLGTFVDHYSFSHRLNSHTLKFIEAQRYLVSIEIHTDFPPPVEFFSLSEFNLRFLLPFI